MSSIPVQLGGTIERQWQIYQALKYFVPDQTLRVQQRAWELEVLGVMGTKGYQLQLLQVTKQEFQELRGCSPPICPQVCQQESTNVVGLYGHE